MAGRYLRSNNLSTTQGWVAVASPAACEAAAPKLDIVPVSAGSDGPAVLDDFAGRKVMLPRRLCQIPRRPRGEFHRLVALVANDEHKLPGHAVVPAFSC